MNLESKEWGNSLEIELDFYIKHLKEDALKAVGVGKICEIRIMPIHFAIAWYRLEELFDELPLLPPDKTRGMGITMELADFGRKVVRSKERILYERFKTGE